MTTDERIYMIASPEWEGDTVHGHVHGPADADMDALWLAFRQEFSLAGPFPFASPALQASPYAGQPGEAFLQWLMATRGFRRADAVRFSPTFGPMEEQP